MLISLNVNFLVEKTGRDHATICHVEESTVGGRVWPSLLHRGRFYNKQLYRSNKIIILYEWVIFVRLSTGIAFWRVNLYINLLNQSAMDEGHNPLFLELRADDVRDIAV